MATIKISQLPAATSPVASTDVLPVVQGGVTKKASINALGYLPSGSNVVTRTLQDKLRDVVSVKDFGAVGNGVADDTTAVTNAFSSGKSIYFPAGTYKTRGAINVSSNCVYYGDGIGKTILAADVVAFGDYNIKPDGVSNVWFSNISFRGSVVQNSTGNRAFGVYVKGCENITFTGCSFDTFTTHALTIIKAEGAWIDSGNPNSSASVTNLLNKCSKNIHVSNCYFDNNGSNHMAVFGGNGVVVENSTFTNRAQLTAFFTDDASSATPLQDYNVNDGVIFANNVVDSLPISINGCATGAVTGNTISSYINYRSYDFDQQAVNIANPFWWFNYMPRRGFQITGNVCTQLIFKTGLAVSAIGNTVIRTSNAAFVVLNDNLRLGWGSATGTNVCDSAAQSTESTTPLVVSNNTFIAKANVTNGITVGDIPKLYASLMNNVVVEDGGTITNVIDSGYALNWNYSYFRNNKFTMSERNGLRVSDGTIESATISSAQIPQFVLSDSTTTSKGLFARSTFASNYDLTANYNYNTSTIGSASYGTCAVRLQPSNSRVRLAVGDTNTAPTEVLQITNNAVLPVADDTFPFGSVSNRWTVIYAVNGTIQTSDGREKQQVADLNDAERKVAARIKGLIKKFKFNEAVKAKGDQARIHVGVVAQDVKAAFEAEGLDPSKYGLFCYDEWEDQYELNDAGEKVLIRPAGNRHGIRYDELLAFVISAM